MEPRASGQGADRTKHRDREHGLAVPCVDCHAGPWLKESIPGTCVGTGNHQSRPSDILNTRSVPIPGGVGHRPNLIRQSGDLWQPRNFTRFFSTAHVRTFGSTGWCRNPIWSEIGPLRSRHRPSRDFAPSGEPNWVLRTLRNGTQQSPSRFSHGENASLGEILTKIF